MMALDDINPFSVDRTGYPQSSPRQENSFIPNNAYNSLPYPGDLEQIARPMEKRLWTQTLAACIAKHCANMVDADKAVCAVVQCHNLD